MNNLFANTQYKLRSILCSASPCRNRVRRGAKNRIGADANDTETVTRSDTINYIARSTLKRTRRQKKVIHRVADHILNCKLVQCARNKLKLCVNGSSDNQSRWFTAKYVNSIDESDWVLGPWMYELLRQCERQKSVISWSRKTMRYGYGFKSKPKIHRLTSEPCFIFNMHVTKIAIELLLWIALLYSKENQVNQRRIPI